MNTTNSGQLSYKEACTVGSATAAAVARAPVGATKEVLDKLDKANAAAEAEANLQVDRAAKKAKRKAKKLEKQAAIEKGKRKEAKQKRRTEKTRVVEEEQARAESARKVRREAKRATREEKREEKRASADSAVVADLLSLSSHDFPQASLLLSTDNVVAADHGEVGGTASAPDMDDDALDDELVKSLDATEAEVMRRSATAAGGDEFAQCHATAAEADANSVAEADSEVESEAKAVEAGFASFGCRTCGYSGGTQCDCAFYEDYSEDGNGEGGGACGDGEGAGDACDGNAASSGSGDACDGNAASSGSGTSGGLQVGGYGCGWQPGAHCDLSDLDSEAEIEEAERCVDAEAERAWRLAHEAQPKGGGSVEQSVVKLEDINGTVAAKKRSVNVGIYETGQRETKFLRRSDNRGSNARRAAAITGELNAVAMPALSIAPVAAAAATPAAAPAEAHVVTPVAAEAATGRVWTTKQLLALNLFHDGCSLALLGAAGTGKTAVIVEMLRKAMARTAVVVCANNVQLRNFKLLMKEHDVNGVTVLTLHAAIGVWPGDRETATSLAAKIITKVGASLRKKAKIALAKSIWFVDQHVERVDGSWSRSRSFRSSTMAAVLVVVGGAECAPQK